MNPLTDILPPSTRKLLYAVYGLIGVALGSLQIVSINAAHLAWVSVALAVFAYVGTAFGFTSASNITDTSSAPLLDTEPAPEVHPDDSQPAAATTVPDAPETAQPTPPAPPTPPPAPPVTNPAPVDSNPTLPGLGG